MKKVALITSGGDGSGINAAIEIMSREKSIDLYGFNGGFDGILDNQSIHLTRELCENHSLDGKHLIKTSRSKLPFTKEGRSKLQEKLLMDNFEYLIICGGNGSLKAAQLLNLEGTKTLFIPMTIDNDINGSDYTIGFDTALNRIVDVIYGLQDTASNMPGRIFLVEVLGGDSGNLALESSIAGACDLAIIPEFSTSKNRIVEVVKKKLETKKSIIIICSESAYEEKDYRAGNQGVSFEIGEFIEEKTNIRVRKTIMGFHMRAGRPFFKDALIASQIGAMATKCIKNNKFGKMIGLKSQNIQIKDLDEMLTINNSINPQLLDIALENDIILTNS